jgi:hypothetical protein
MTYFLPLRAMFDFFDEDMFAEAVWEHLNVLDRGYVEDQCHDLLQDLRSAFDDQFETAFIILDRETGKPMNVNAVLTKRDAAEEFLQVAGADKFEIGILLRDC